eukprot:jgi/Picsp_1/2270/NSC_05734-R1_biotin holocarboxylase synthetase
MRVVVYQGPGAGSRSVLSVVQSLQRALRPYVRVETIGKDGLISVLNRRDAINEDWRLDCLALIMPGGADLPYCKQLNGDGNRIIKQYVLDGGAYIGLCAGAYFGCAEVEFEVGNPLLEVTGPRELKFFSGCGKGSIVPGFEYQTEKGASPCLVRYVDWLNSIDQCGNVVSCSMLWKTTLDYVNGGPYFCKTDATPVRINTRLGENVEVIATYPDKSHLACAIQCQVGKGRAVLCSSHPELEHEWLKGSVMDVSDKVFAMSESGHPDLQESKEYLHHLNHLVHMLEGHASDRRDFWKTILCASGLKNHIKH